MGRLGVTYPDVEKAAEQLKAQKINPTVDNVRIALGTGSRSTIVPYLKRWRAQQPNLVQENDAEITNLREALAELQKNLYKADNDRSKLMQERAELRAELERMVSV